MPFVIYINSIVSVYLTTFAQGLSLSLGDTICLFGPSRKTKWVFLTSL